MCCWCGVLGGVFGGLRRPGLNAQRARARVARVGPSDLLGCVTRGTYLERLATEQLFIVRAAGVGSRSPYVTRSLSAQVC